MGVSYKIGSSVSLHTALCVNFTSGLNPKHDVRDGAVPENFSFNYLERNEVPSLQVAPEVNFGFDYDIGSKLRFMFFGAVSLGDVKGVSWDYVLTEQGEAPQAFDIDFDYRWWRFGVGLTYHIVN